MYWQEKENDTCVCFDAILVFPILQIHTQIVLVVFLILLVIGRAMLLNYSVSNKYKYIWILCRFTSLLSLENCPISRKNNYNNTTITILYLQRFTLRWAHSFSLSLSSFLCFFSSQRTFYYYSEFNEPFVLCFQFDLYTHTLISQVKSSQVRSPKKNL